MITSNNKNAQLAIRYLQCWGNKDLASLELLLTENCMAIDWEGVCLGRDKILSVTKAFFDNTKMLRVDVKKIAVGQDCIMAELEIFADKTRLFVTDVLDYNEEGKIQRIRAYKI